MTCQIQESDNKNVELESRLQEMQTKSKGHMTPIQEKEEEKEMPPSSSFDMFKATGNTSGDQQREAISVSPLKTIIRRKANRKGSNESLDEPVSNEVGDTEGKQQQILDDQALASELSQVNNLHYMIS